ncbi:hypothetical protein ACH4T9_19990 [Micromonospora sp. NPDC020750]|uniref:hypothetical protein n=1 Tax=unclassified Micromonospora TaxID=2617518 RepID=UPI0037A7C9C9
MAIASGQRITPALLRRLRPAYYTAQATSDLGGVVTTTLVPGATVTFTVETAAAWYVDAVFDVDTTGASTGLALGYCEVDGTIVSGQATCANEVLTDRHSVAQQWSGVFASAGSHTIRLKVTLPTAVSVRTTNTRFRVTIQEVV